MAHGLGKFIGWLMVVGVFIASGVLSFTFFSGIAPPGKPWFAWFMLFVTEIGLASWLAVFRLTNHNPTAKVIAIVMIVLSLAAVATTDALELSILMSDHNLIASNPWLLQTSYEIFVAMFIAHFVALVCDIFASYFAMHPFRDYTEPKQVTSHAASNSYSQTGEIETEYQSKNAQSLPNKK